MVQIVGEFEDKLNAADLTLLIQKPETPVYVMADGRHFWRVIDNLMNNICKYAQPGTRVYVDLRENGGQVELIFRNTSRYPLNISSEELMERFVRGDESRNTEGSGLGISIAKSLMELMGGSFMLYVDGDLFKVVKLDLLKWRKKKNHLMKIKAENRYKCNFLTLSENFACFFDKPSVTMQKKTEPQETERMHTGERQKEGGL